MNKKIEKLNKVFLNSWMRFESKSEFSFEEMKDKFMRSQLNENEYRRWRVENAVDYIDVDGVFVPDMSDRQIEMTMQERFRSEVPEPRYWDEPITKFDEMFIPEGVC